MSTQLDFNLDQDLRDIFVHMQQLGHTVTLDTVLLIQILRRLDEPVGFDDQAPSNAGVNFVPTATPVPPADPALHHAVETIRQPNQTLLSDLEASSADSESQPQATAATAATVAAAPATTTVRPTRPPRPAAPTRPARPQVNR